MYQFAAAQQNNTVKLPAFFMRFQREKRFPRVNKTRVTREDTFNRYHFDVKRNYELIKNKKTLFWVVFQII